MLATTHTACTGEVGEGRDEEVEEEVAQEGATQFGPALLGRRGARWSRSSGLVAFPFFEPDLPFPTTLSSSKGV